MNDTQVRVELSEPLDEASASTASNEDTYQCCQGEVCSCVPGWTGEGCDRCVIYVNQAGGDDANSGGSWQDAMATVQTELSAAQSDGCEVCVAQGTHTPGTERTDTV